jgi:hypothetical protein
VGTDELRYEPLLPVAPAVVPAAAGAASAAAAAASARVHSPFGGDDDEGDASDVDEDVPFGADPAQPAGVGGWLARTRPAGGPPASGARSGWGSLLSTLWRGGGGAMVGVPAPIGGVQSQHYLARRAGRTLPLLPLLPGARRIIGPAVPVHGAVPAAGGGGLLLSALLSPDQHVREPPALAMDPAPPPAMVDAHRMDPQRAPFGLRGRHETFLGQYGRSLIEHMTHVCGMDTDEGTAAPYFRTILNYEVESGREPHLRYYIAAINATVSDYRRTVLENSHRRFLEANKDELKQLWDICAPSEGEIPDEQERLNILNGVIFNRMVQLGHKPALNAYREAFVAFLSGN